MPMLGGPQFAVAPRSHTGNERGLWPVRQRRKASRRAGAAWPTQVGPGLRAQADDEHRVGLRVRVTADLGKRPAEALQ